MSRQVYLLGIAMVLVAGALVLTDALLWEPGVTEANGKRIRPGMRMPEVEGLLGSRGRPVLMGLQEVDDWFFWGGDDGDVMVLTGPAGRVREAHWLPLGQQQPGPWANLRAWLGW
jgi:hypothetical protein